MKIGIITYWDSPNNHGQVLQGFATEYLLRKRGHKPFIIRFGREDDLCAVIDPWWKKIMRLLKGERSISQIIRRKTAMKQEAEDRGFNEFRCEYMTYSSEYYPNFKKLIEECPKADCFVTGSDQVWAYFGAIETHRSFLLDFLPDGTPRFSFSSSFCRTTMPEVHKELYERCLKKYVAVSVRENSGVKLCASLGVNAEHIIDPSFLLNKDEWCSALPFNTTKAETERKVVFFYIVTFDTTMPHIYKLMDGFQKAGYEVIYCHSCVFLDKKRNSRPTILDWLSYIKTSDLVVTNSFHGFAFALNFNTPFVALSKGKDLDVNGQDSRMYSVLCGTGLEKRLMSVRDTNSILENAFDNIGWERVNNLLDKQRQKAYTFLDEALIRTGSNGNTLH